MTVVGALWVRSRGSKVDQDYRWLSADGRTAELAELAPRLPEEVLVGGAPVACVGGFGPKGEPVLYLGGLPRHDGQTDFAGRPIRVDLLIAGDPSPAWCDLLTDALSRPEGLGLDSSVELDPKASHGFVVRLALEDIVSAAGVSAQDAIAAPPSSVRQKQRRTGPHGRDEAIADLRSRLAMNSNIEPGQVLLMVSDYVTDRWCLQHDPWRVVSANATEGEGRLAGPKGRRVAPTRRRSNWAVPISVTAVALLALCLIKLLA